MANRSREPAIAPSCRGVESRPDFRTVMIGRAEGVIVPYQRVREATWTPTEVDVRTLESGLVAHLKSVPPVESPRLYRKAARYKRQYVGICEGGTPILYAFYMCHAPPGWKDRAVSVHDGGDCYFSVHFDITTRRYLYVIVNGQA
jgi:hypothetical protein